MKDNMQIYNFNAFVKKTIDVLACHDMEVNEEAIIFSEKSIEQAENGKWDGCATELRDNLEKILSPILSSHHKFERDPYVRRIDLPDGKIINIGIINQQSKEWYDSPHFIATCDFLLEAHRGLFQNCSKFIDLGGHQMVWAVYYGMTNNLASVKSFEPSILNVLIGLFNCLINDVIDRVSVIPYAVSVATSSSEKSESNKMIVDYINIPMRTCQLSDYISDDYDFIKTDIEGYEYELLSDKQYVHLLKKAKYSHFELHLGHLIKRGITLEDCVNALKRAGLNGSELHSQANMYDFLHTCDRNGFHAFVIK